MKIKKSELKNLVKECVSEVLTEMSQPKPYDFDEDWNRMDEQGVPVIHLTDEEFDSFVTKLNEAKSYKSVENILKG